MSLPLKSCLRKPGSPKNPHSIRFHEKIRLVTEKNQEVEIDLPKDQTRSRKMKDKAPELSDESTESLEDLGPMDLSKYLGKSIYDSSTEEETEDKKPDSDATPEVTEETKKGKVKKGKKEKSDKGEEKDNKKKQKLSIAEILRRKRKPKSSMKGVHLHCNLKDLASRMNSKDNDGETTRTEEDREASALSMFSKEDLLVDGYFSMKTVGTGGDMRQCKFSFMGNGVLDCFQVSAAEGVAEFLYYISYLALGSSDESLYEEVGRELTESKSQWVILECAPCSQSDECENFSNISCPRESSNVLFLFSSSSDRSKFVSVVKHFFVNGTTVRKSKSKLTTIRQSSAKNLSKVFKGKEKGEKVPFPGIALHGESPFPGIAFHDENLYSKSGKDKGDEDKGEGKNKRRKTRTSKKPLLTTASEDSKTRKAKDRDRVRDEKSGFRSSASDIPVQPSTTLQTKVDSEVSKGQNKRGNGKHSTPLADNNGDAYERKSSKKKTPPTDGESVQLKTKEKKQKKKVTEGEAKKTKEQTAETDSNDQEGSSKEVKKAKKKKKKKEKEES